MTLTLLLQLTDDEQLYARQEETPEVKPSTEQVAPEVNEQPAAAWPVEAEA